MEPLKQCCLPQHCVFLDLRQIENFVDQINNTRSCRTAGGQGMLVPCDAVTCGMGGAVRVTYTCSGCRCALEFQTFSRRNKLAVQVAFITAGCTYATYVKALQHVLGIRPVSTHTFMRTIETLHPIVEQMVDEMCEREKQRMRRIDPRLLEESCYLCWNVAYQGLSQQERHVFNTELQHRSLALLQTHLPER